MTELTDALMDATTEAVLDDLLDRRGIKLELSAVQMGDPETWAEIEATLGAKILAALSRVLAERGLKVTGREATEGMKEEGAKNIYDPVFKPSLIANHVWFFMHRAAPNLLEVKP